MTHFGAAIRKMREKHGWTQEQLGSKVGLSAGNISQIEAGRHDAPLRTRRALAKVFGVHPLVLIADLPPEVCQIIDELMAMTQKSRLLALRLIRAIPEEAEK